jgi:hypothetical protein
MRCGERQRALSEDVNRGLFLEEEIEISQIEPGRIGSGGHFWLKEKNIQSTKVCWYDAKQVRMFWLSWVYEEGGGKEDEG